MILVVVYCLQGRGPSVELALEDLLNSKVLVDLVLREGAHAELTLEDLFKTTIGTGQELGKGPIVELTHEDLVVFLILKAVIPDPELEIFLLHPRCSVQLDR